jgi:hypothetical protein
MESQCIGRHPVDDIPGGMARVAFEEETGYAFDGYPEGFRIARTLIVD